MMVPVLGSRARREHEGRHGAGGIPADGEGTGAPGTASHLEAPREAPHVNRARVQAAAR
jgi:hypothetical protein